MGRVAQFDYRPEYTVVQVLVAVGGVLKEANGISDPQFFFAKLYYGDTTVPFRVEMDTSQFCL